MLIKKNWEKIWPKLHELGLTRQEASIYLFLIQVGASPAKEVANRLTIPVPAVYRSARELVVKGLVSEVETWPRQFIAKPPQIALAEYVESQSYRWRQLAVEMSGRKTLKASAKAEPTRVNLIFGQKEMFESSTKAFADAKEEILVVSIGEELPKELLLAQRRAILRGVTSRMIAHKYDATNKDILRNFQRNGIEVRHFPDWGFHLVVVDGRRAMLAANNPKNTKERVGIEFYSKGLAKALRDYFYAVWVKAMPVEK